MHLPVLGGWILALLDRFWLVAVLSSRSPGISKRLPSAHVCVCPSVHSGFRLLIASLARMILSTEPCPASALWTVAYLVLLGRMAEKRRLVGPGPGNQGLSEDLLLHRPRLQPSSEVSDPKLPAPKKRR